MAVYDEVFPDGTPYPPIPLGTNVVNVSTSSALSSALSSATAGQRIVLANGTYTGDFSMSGRQGSASAGISVEAATPGGASIGAGSTWRITNCAYVTVSGLLWNWQGEGETFQFRGSSHHCRVTRCTFGPSTHTESANVQTWIYVGDDAYHIRIDHNEIRNKGTSGNGVRVYGSFDKVDSGQGSSAGCRWVRIDHNLFRSIKPEVGNDKEPVRYGVSTMSRTITNGVIERNHFHDCICEPELISVKMGAIRVSGNTITQCAGGPVIRHGTNSIMSDNYVIDRAGTFGETIGSGGIRFYDADHTIAYNYVDGVVGGNFQGPLLLDTGDAEGSSTNLSAHWRVIGAMVERNVIVGGPEGIRIGDNYSSVPRDCTIRDNLVVDTDSGAAITQRVAPSATVLTNNTYYGTTSAAGMTQDADTVWRKPGYGPRLSYLEQTDVGPAADLGDTDGTGTESGGGTAPVAVPADVLNIGLDEQQNHYRLSYAANGSASVTTATLAEVAAGLAVDPHFKVIDRSAGGTSTLLATETFGKETDGVGMSDSTATKMAASMGSPDQDGVLTAGHARAWLNLAGSAATKLLVYADSAGSPGALLATSDEVTVSATTETLYDYAFSGSNQIDLVAGTNYWMALAWADPGTPSLQFSRDDVNGGRVEQTGFTYPAMPNPFGTPSGTFTGPIDVWMEYETETPGGPSAVGGTAVQFHVRADAAIASGAVGPASELHEVRPDGSTAVFDAMFGSHRLHTRARITRLPGADPEVVVLRLFDGTADQLSVRTVAVTGGAALVVQIGGVTMEPSLVGNYSTGSEFELDVRILDGTVQVLYGGSTTPLVTGQLSATAGVTWQWRLGAYAQFTSSSAGSSTEYVAVEHRDLITYHAPASVDAGPDAQVVAGLPFSRTALEPGITNVLSRRWTIVSRPAAPEEPGGGDADDLTIAAVRYGWGTPLPQSDEFNYVGPPDSSKWQLPGNDWAGHAGNGRRRPERTTVDGEKLVMTGLANGDSGWVEHQLGQQYGRWEARIRCFPGAPSAGEPDATSNGNDYHCLLLIWPDSNSRQDDGEYDFYELGEPGQDSLEAFMHYPHPGTEVVQQRHFEKPGVDTSQWHNVALEWTPEHLKGFVDGVEWFSASGGANDVRRNIQDMPSGHGTIQLDNFDGTDQTPATIEVMWYRVYSL